MVWNGFRQMGQGLANWARTRTNNLEDAESPQEILTTGNKFKDIGVGLLAGLGQADNQRINLYPMSNWVGNGIARTGFAQFNNPRYIDTDNLSKVLSNRLSKLNRLKQNTRDAGANMGNVYYNDIYSTYELPTSVNNYQRPGVYQGLDYYNPYKLPTTLYNPGMEVRDWNVKGEY